MSVENKIEYPFGILEHYIFRIHGCVPASVYFLFLQMMTRVRVTRNNGSFNAHASLNKLGIQSLNASTLAGLTHNEKNRVSRCH